MTSWYRTRLLVRWGFRHYVTLSYYTVPKLADDLSITTNTRFNCMDDSIVYHTPYQWCAWLEIHFENFQIIFVLAETIGIDIRINVLFLNIIGSITRSNVFQENRSANISTKSINFENLVELEDLENPRFSINFNLYYTKISNFITYIYPIQFIKLTTLWKFRNLPQLYEFKNLS